MTAQANEVINVQPHPRLLGVLGDIEFQPWQCLAELADNAFDEFLRHPGQVGDTPTVVITLPGRTSTPREGEVWVRDNGPGMTLEQLNNALRAGWTSNERYGQLGLFGVGFNIATARLGHVAQVRTARATDDAWTSVTIDLRALAAGGDFLLPVTLEPKSSPDEHGTVVVIRDLKPEHHDTLSRQQTKIKGVLGDVYSHLLEHQGFRLIIDGDAVKPRRACVWSQERHVVRQGERIPAVIQINERLADRAACQNCGLWQDPEVERCDACNSDRLQVRERRIRGWLGIQRYLSKSDYGIDFIRNGRKILLRDVSLFFWEDPDDPSGRGVPEYPVELPAGTGRIVGEIHVDHVRVNYQKNAFEYDTPDWKRVVRTLRGEGPVLVKTARKLGYPVNKSPLAQLHTGYRRNVPGLNYLIPGDGTRPIHEKAKEWADLFRKGVPEYQTDQKWYEAAARHDQPPASTDPFPSAGDNPSDILAAKGLTPPPSGPATPLAPSPPMRPTTEDERRDSWRAAGTRLSDMEGPYGLPGHGAALAVTVWLVNGYALRRPNSDDRVPVYVGAGRGSQVEVFVDGGHPVFLDFAADTRDLIVVELAEYLRVRDSSDQSLSALFYEIKQRCLPDHKVSGAFITDNANRLLSRVREAMLPVVAGNASGYWAYVGEGDQAAAEQAYALEGGSDGWEDVVSIGDGITYVPASGLVRIVQHKPEAFLDGRVFRAAFIRLTDQTARAVSAERIVDLLSDVAALADRPTRRSTEELQRGRLSCLLLEQELSPPAEDR